VLDPYAEACGEKALGVWRYNRPMDERELMAQLNREGFAHTYVWEDGAHAHYPEHTHRTETAHIILSGEMTLTMAERRRRIAAGSVVMCLRARCTRRRWGQEGAATWLGKIITRGIRIV